MKTLAPVTRRRTTTADTRAQIAAWCEAHPGFDESNWTDAFRDTAGNLIETDEFSAASFLFALPH